MPWFFDSLTIEIEREHAMIARIQNRLKADDKGFTLIELLVVMIIIGILAAIAIPIFLSQREKAQDSAAKADVSTLGKEIATYYVDGTGVPVVAIVVDQWQVDGTDVGSPSTNVALKAAPASTATGTDWCVSVVNDEGDVTTTTSGGASYSSASGLETGADVDC